MNEKRISQRVDVKGITADISDGMRVFQYCEVVNVSNGGLMVEGINKKALSKNTSSFDIVVTIDDRPIRLKCVPRWFRTSANSSAATVGFKITKDVNLWGSRIGYLLPKNEADIWGNRGLKYMH